jgi:hypothetical protein
MKLYYITNKVDLKLEALEVQKETSKLYFCTNCDSNRQIAKDDRSVGGANPNVFFDPDSAVAEFRKRIDETIADLNRSYAEAVRAVAMEGNSLSRQQAPVRPMYALLKTFFALVNGAISGGLGKEEALNLMHGDAANVARHLATLDDEALEVIREKIAATVLKSSA